MLNVVAPLSVMGSRATGEEDKERTRRKSMSTGVHFLVLSDLPRSE